VSDVKAFLAAVLALLALAVLAGSWAPLLAVVAFLLGGP
jgi:hypothetical protein